MSVSKAQIKLVRSLQQKKYRDELGLFVAEGDKCVEELQKGFELLYLYREGENATRVEIEQMSGLQTPQGTIGVFRKLSEVSHQKSAIRSQPSEVRSQKSEVRSQKSEVRSQKSEVSRQKSEGGDNLILVLDGVQNPGNLGTIIRTCDWFGVHEIICSPDTADCYNPKVVQATMGALVRVRVHYTDLTEWLSAISRQNSDVRIYGTLLDGEDMYEVFQKSEVSSQKSAVSSQKSEVSRQKSAVSSQKSAVSCHYGQ